MKVKIVSFLLLLQLFFFIFFFFPLHFQHLTSWKYLRNYYDSSYGVYLSNIPTLNVFLCDEAAKYWDTQVVNDAKIQRKRFDSIPTTLGYLTLMC